MAGEDSSKMRKTACLELLKAAKSDNERLAAILLVPKLFSTISDNVQARGDQASASQPATSTDDSVGLSNGTSDTADLDKQFQKDLFEAINFSFLRRMLSGSETSVVEDSLVREERLVASLSADSMSLKSAALSVIMCFSEQDILSKPQISQTVEQIEYIVSALTKVLSGKADETKAGEADVKLSADETREGESNVKLSADETREGESNVKLSADAHDQLNDLCIQCLENFARNLGTDDVEEFVFPAIYRVVMKQSSRGPLVDRLVILLSNTLGERGTDWLGASSRSGVCAIYLHQIKISGLEAIDFTGCESASRIISTLTTEANLKPGLSPLVDSVMGLLCDALKSKLPSQQRQQALKLLTTLIRNRGIRKLIEDKGSKAALLVIHLCCIEVRMTLEQDDRSQVVRDSETLCASFFALEQMIFYMAHEETTLALDSREIIQVHSALQGAVSAIIYFLTGCADEQAADPQEVGSDISGVVAACMRLLGAWTAEETESLLGKYTKVLPHLITLCSIMLAKVDSFKFLVPGLSNFTTDTEGIVEVIVDKLDFMATYIQHCCAHIRSGKEEYEHVLVNCCVVILNCLMMPEIKLPIAPIYDLLDTVAAETCSLLPVCKNLDCNLTMMVCGLASVRKLFELEEPGKTTERGQQLQLTPDKESRHEQFYKQSVEYMLSITDGARSGVKSADIPDIWLMGVQVLGDLMKKSVLLKDLLIEERHIRKALQLFDKHSSNVDVAFVLERLLLTMADQAGTKDLITQINKAKK